MSDDSDPNGALVSLRRFVAVDWKLLVIDAIVAVCWAGLLTLAFVAWGWPTHLFYPVLIAGAVLYPFVAESVRRGVAR